MATIYLGNDDADSQASANLLPLVETLQRAGHKVSIRGATPEALARLREMAGGIRLVTNTSSISRKEVIVRVRNAGFDVAG